MQEEVPEIKGGIQPKQMAFTAEKQMELAEKLQILENELIREIETEVNKAINNINQRNI